MDIFQQFDHCEEKSFQVGENWRNAPIPREIAAMRDPSWQLDKGSVTFARPTQNGPDDD